MGTAIAEAGLMTGMPSPSLALNVADRNRGRLTRDGSQSERACERMHNGRVGKRKTSKKEQAALIRLLQELSNQVPGDNLLHHVTQRKKSRSGARDPRKQKVELESGYDFEWTQRRQESRTLCAAGLRPILTRMELRWCCGTVCGLCCARLRNYGRHAGAAGKGLP